jgi:hypothetical protein
MGSITLILSTLAVLAPLLTAGASSACSNYQLAQNGYAHCADVDQGTFVGPLLAVTRHTIDQSLSQPVCLASTLTSTKRNDVRNSYTHSRQGCGQSLPHCLARSSSGRLPTNPPSVLSDCAPPPTVPLSLDLHSTCIIDLVDSDSQNVLAPVDWLCSEPATARQLIGQHPWRSHMQLSVTPIYSTVS